MLRIREVQPAQAAAAGTQQLAFFDEVGGEEDHQHHLRQFAGLEGEPTNTNPQPSAVDLRAEAGHERNQQCGHTE